MAFVNASGAKKFKPAAWQSVQINQHRNEEKENSDVDMNGQASNNNHHSQGASDDIPTEDQG